MAGLVIKYKGNNIVETDEAITKVLKSSGKHCEEDFIVNYSGSSDGSGNTDGVISPNILPSPIMQEVI